jgi:predicted site-specific integrase-resolvase
MLISELNSPTYNWLSLDEAQEVSRVSRSTLYSWLRAGLVQSSTPTIPGKKRGRRLVSARSLSDFLEKSAQGGAA